jgi:hypothetical protein
MGRRRRGLQKISLAMLMLTGMLLAAPAASSGGREVDVKTRPSCADTSVPNLMVDYSTQSPRLLTLDCVGAPTGCGPENQYY